MMHEVLITKHIIDQEAQYHTYMVAVDLSEWTSQQKFVVKLFFERPKKLPSTIRVRVFQYPGNKCLQKATLDEIWRA